PVLAGPLPGAGAVDLTAGANFTCALLSNNSASCWGENAHGELGNGRVANSAVPGEVRSDANIVALGAGDHHACAILADGSVSCWGGFLVNNVTLLPVTMNLPAPPSIEVTGGAAHACAMKSNGNSFCFGSDNLGQIGNGTVNTSAGTVAGISGLFLARSVSAGAEFTCARRGNGTVACWGAGGEGQLGNGTNSSSLTPSNVPALANITAIT